MEIEYTFHTSVFVFILSYDFKDITNETYWNLKIFNKNSEKMIFFLNIYYKNVVNWFIYLAYRVKDTTGQPFHRESCYISTIFSFSFEYCDGMKRNYFKIFYVNEA